MIRIAHSRFVRLTLGRCIPLLAAALVMAGVPEGSARQLARTQSTGTAEASSGASRLGPAAAATHVPPVIVIGFVGGYVRHDDQVHGVVQLAARLRKDYPSGVYVAVFENRRREQAHQEILRLLDAGKRGKPSEAEKKNANVIIYGHSWGASETVTLARVLAADGIPLLLTIQVDSVSKIGQDDGTIPANVAQAANFYQSNGLLHGRAEIRAADASRTIILGNFRFDYKAHPLACERYPWYDNLFMKAHTEIECDPTVWKQVEALIRAKLPAVAGPAPAG